MNRLRFGIIGYGGMGQFHARSISQTNGCTVKSVHDIDPLKNSLAERDGYISHVTLDTLLDDNELDAVIVATPNNFHKEHSLAALRAKKHVVCEKPVMLSVADLEQVIATANDLGMLFCSHQNRRWDEDYAIVRQILADGTIGKPFYIESRVQGANGIPGDWRCEAVAGGGMLLDWGTHLIDQILQMVDSPIAEVYAHLLNIKYQVDDNFKLLMRFQNGISALIEVDTYTFIPLPRWHISGDAGTLVVEGFTRNGKIIRANHLQEHYEPSIVYTASGPTKTMAPRPVKSTETLPLPEVHTSHLDFYHNFAAAACGKATPYITHSQMLMMMHVIEAAQISSAEGKVIKFKKE